MFVFRPPDYSFHLCFIRPRFRVKGTGVKGAASPETKPDFYSKLFIKANDASTTLKRDLEGKFALKMEEECKCSDPAKCQKKQAEKMMNYKEYDMCDNVFSSQRNTSLLIGIPSIIPPITGSKLSHLSACSSSFDFGSSTTVYTFSRHQRIQTTVHLTLGMNRRFAKVSQRLLCRLYSPSKTPSFLRPTLPSRWMRLRYHTRMWISK